MLYTELSLLFEDVLEVEATVERGLSVFVERFSLAVLAELLQHGGFQGYGPQTLAPTRHVRHHPFHQVLQLHYDFLRDGDHFILSREIRKVRKGTGEVAKPGKTFLNS